MRKIKMKKVFGVVALAALLGGCESVSRDAAPVQLRAVSEINSTVLDLENAVDPTAFAEVLVSSVIKDLENSSPTLLDVKLKSYRVSYIRTDGGRTIPAPFVVAVNQLIPSGGTTVPLDNFNAVDPTALSNAPFAALLPQNGGVDPDTGRRNVELDVRVEVFGETLSGEDVYATTRFPLTICYGCT
jgi:hypothetical protein